MSLELVLAVVGGLVVGGVAALKIIAPKTKSTIDDAVLARLEKLEELLKALMAK